MTVIRPNSISGITSLTAAADNIEFYNFDGSAPAVLALNINAASGVSTFASVKVGAAITITSGIIEATEFRGNGEFLTGVTPFSSGTLMLFQQTAAPTGWTKQTTHNDKTLRVVSGSASSGGTTAFTSVFTSRTPAGSVSGTNSGGSVANSTLSTAQLASHSHSITTNYSFYNGGRVTSSDGSYTNNTAGTNSEGSGSAHGHSFTDPTWSGSFTGSSMDFDVQYVDLIIASKD